MLKRNCPKCGSHLNNSDKYFCSNCGEKLPNNLIKTSKEIRVRTYVPGEAPRDASIIKKLAIVVKSKSNLALVGLSIVIIGALFIISRTGVFELLGLKINGSEVSQTPSLIDKVIKNEPKELDLGLNATGGEFGQVSFITAAPEKTEIYFEGNSLGEVLDQINFESPNVELISRAKLLLEPQFSGFSYKEGADNRWGFIFIPKDAALVQQVVGEIEHEYWKLRIVGDYLIIANGEDVFGLVEKTLSKEVRSLSLNPNYVKKVQELSKEGQFLVLFMENGAKESLRVSLNGLTQESIGILMGVVNSKLEHLVIKEENAEAKGN